MIDSVIREFNYSYQVIFNWVIDLVIDDVNSIESYLCHGRNDNNQ